MMGMGGMAMGAMGMMGGAGMAGGRAVPGNLSEASTMACRFYGSELGCRFGDVCHYSHDQPNSIMMCKNFQTGSCYYGDKCRYRHQHYKEPSRRGGTLDEDPNVEVCKFFNEPAGCIRGSSCKFRHIDSRKKSDKADNDEETDDKEKKKSTPDAEQEDGDKNKDEEEANTGGNDDNDDAEVDQLSKGVENLNVKEAAK